jgi:hypothetical protein
MWCVLGVTATGLSDDPMETLRERRLGNTQVTAWKNADRPRCSPLVSHGNSEWVQIGVDDQPRRRL